MPVPFLSGTPSTGGGASGGGGAGGTWGPPSTPGEPGTTKPSDNLSGGFNMQPGATPYPLPNPNGETPFSGGQCPGVLYNVWFNQKPSPSSQNSYQTRVIAAGPIYGVSRKATPTGQFSGGSPTYLLEILLSHAGGETNVLLGGSRRRRVREFELEVYPTEIDRVEPIDGSVDDCGDPPKPSERYRPPNSAPGPNDPQAPATPGPPGPPGPPGADGRDGEDGEPARPVAPGPGSPVGGNPGGGTPGVGSPGGDGSGGGGSGSGGPSTPGGSIPPTSPNTPPEAEPEPEACDPCEKIDELMKQLKDALLAEGSGSIPLPVCPPPPVEDSEDTTDPTSVDD